MTSDSSAPGILATPERLTEMAGQKFPPTPEQAAIIGANPGPLLAIAGAGAGKTETMAWRVVWLVTNRMCTPSEVLGLTFTRKAAAQLSTRVRKRLRSIASAPDSHELLCAGDAANVLDRLAEEAPTVLTYDAYAQRLVSTYGPLLGIEPGARLLSDTEYHRVVSTVVRDYPETLGPELSTSNLVADVASLGKDLDAHMLDIDDVHQANDRWSAYISGLEVPARGVPTDISKVLKACEYRTHLLRIVSRLDEYLREHELTTFGRVMKQAATLATECPKVRAQERDNYRVVMLDEYQDTSHSQRILLSSLFGAHDPGGSACDELASAEKTRVVTAVGDPMQAIYGWRGATSSNLEGFTDDFGSSNTPVVVRELTRSWRNPSLVLTVANLIADDSLGDKRDRVSPLQPRDDAGSGVVQAGWFGSAVEEIDYIADYLEKRYTEHQRAGTPFTAAVLIRANSQSRPIEQALHRRGIPYETASLQGLLRTPEVADVVAFARLIADPRDDLAALKVLISGHVGLGLADIAALAQRAKALHRQTHPCPEPRDDAEATGQAGSAEDVLRKEIAEVLRGLHDEPTGLGDALMDVGSASGVSPTGMVRLKRLKEEVDYLRSVARRTPLPELFLEIVRVTGIREEVLARVQDGSKAVHLDRLHEEVEKYVSAADALGESPTLKGIVRFFAEAIANERGLEPGEITQVHDRVQILTVHKAKGLEWEYVVVPHLTTEGWESTAKNTPRWPLQGDVIPSDILGDAEVYGDNGEIAVEGAPIFRTEGIATMSDANKEVKAFSDRSVAYRNEESARLFYVALTRTEKEVLLTGSSYNIEALFSKKNPKKNPEKNTGEKTMYPHFRRVWDYLEEHHPEAIIHRKEQSPDLTEQVDIEPPVAYFPPRWDRPESVRARTLVQEQIERGTVDASAVVPLARSGGVISRWEEDVEALIRQQEESHSCLIEVPLSDELTASDIVALKNDPTDFILRRIRPVPFKPNPYARRGTAFHQWIQNLFEVHGALIDPEELLDLEDETTERLEVLKERFLDSPWAARTPYAVEHGFEVRIGDSMVKGRMDAVFFNKEENCWEVVDWKTGRQPTGAKWKAASLQLAVYALAWREQRADGLPVKTAFHYVSENRTKWLDSQPSVEELADWLRTTTALEIDEI